MAETGVGAESGNATGDSDENLPIQQVLGLPSPSTEVVDTIDGKLLGAIEYMGDAVLRRYPSVGDAPPPGDELGN